jgi:hypothetical protein
MLEAAQHGWPILGCGSKHRRRRRPAERAVLIEAGVQNFILNGSITAAENVERVVHNLRRSCLTSAVEWCRRSSRWMSCSAPTVATYVVAYQGASGMIAGRGGTGPVALPDLPTASDRHARHSVARAS